MLRALRTDTHQPESTHPRAAIIICLRGADPFTKDCIRGAVTQDYPDFQVKIIVDHALDPAMEVVKETLAEVADVSHVEVECLKAPLPSCSLKCSSLIQAEANLPEDVEVVALLDADATPHATWLRELTAPLADAETAAVTGHRWFMPSCPSVAAAVRYYWNCAAIIQMHLLSVAWGGSLAIRRSTIRQLELPKRWSKAFCEDTMLLQMLRTRGLKLQFAPPVMMINRESCDLTGYFSWVCRQLLTARLYHPGWPLVVLHGLLVPVVPLAAAVLFLYFTLVHAWMLAAFTVAVTVCYFAGLFSILGAMEYCVRMQMARRGEMARWLTPRAWLSLLLAIPVIQVLYPLALAGAMMMRRVTWRGVCYEIKSPWEIRLQEYKRYEAESQPAGHSL